MDIREDRWLSGVFGHRVYRVEPGEPCGKDDATGRLADHVRGQAKALYWAKVPVDQVASAALLAAHGFAPVDVNLVFAARAGEVRPAPLPCGIDVHAARPDEHDALIRIAAMSFRFSRFHLDPLVPRATADAVKREWVRSYVRGTRGDRVLAATVGGAPAGFLAELASDRKGERVRIIDLVAVEPAFRGRGVGRALVRAFLAEGARRADVLEVGTQAANVPSARLYESEGMRLAAAKLVLHRHVGTEESR